MATNNLRVLPVLALLMCGLLAACSQEIGVEDPEAPELPEIIPDEPTQIDIQETALPIIEDFGAVDAEDFFSPGYKALITPASSDIEDDNGNIFTQTDPWPSFYYPTCCFFRTDSVTGELIRTPPFNSDLGTRFRIAGNRLQMSNARFSIGQILSDLTPAIPERKSDTTDSPEGASLELGSWGELNLTQAYRISFCLVDYGLQGSGNSNLELWVDNNSGGRSNESIHGVSSLLIRAALVSAPVLVSGRRIVVDVPGDAYMVNNAGNRVGPTLGVVQPIAEPDFPAGTFSSFLQVRVSNGAYIVISDLVIERQSENNASGMNCTADSAFYVPPPPATPTGLLVVAGDAEIDVSWNVSSAATSYDVLYNTQDSTTAGSPQVVNVAGTSTSTTLTGLTNSTTYYVFVRANNAGGGSNYTSPGASATPEAVIPPPGTPIGLNLIPVSTQINVFWNSDSNATNYDVAFNTVDDPINGATVINRTVNNAVLTGLTDATTYYVFVRASNDTGSSAYTNPGIAATPPGTNIDRTWSFIASSYQAAASVLFNGGTYNPSGDNGIANTGGERGVDGLVFSSTSTNVMRFRFVTVNGVAGTPVWNTNGSFFTSSAVTFPSVGSPITGTLRTYMYVPVETGTAFTIEVDYTQTSSGVTLGKVGLVANDGTLLAVQDADFARDGDTLTVSVGAAHTYTHVKLVYSREGGGSGGVNITRIERDY